MLHEQITDSVTAERERRARYRAERWLRRNEIFSALFFFIFIKLSRQQIHLLRVTTTCVVDGKARYADLRWSIAFDHKHAS